MSSRVTVSDFDPNGLFAEFILPPRFRKRQSETRFKQEWRLTFAQYIAMMQEFKGPFKQRGIVMAAAVMGVTDDNQGLQLTDHSATATDATTATCDIRFRRNGEMSHVRSPDANIVYTDEYYIGQPASQVGDAYELQAMSVGKIGTWTSTAVADDTWTPITGNKSWTVDQLVTGTKTTSAVFQIGLDGTSSPLVSARIECIAVVT